MNTTSTAAYAAVTPIVARAEEPEQKLTAKQNMPMNIPILSNFDALLWSESTNNGTTKTAAENIAIRKQVMHFVAPVMLRGVSVACCSAS